MGVFNLFGFYSAAMIGLSLIAALLITTAAISILETSSDNNQFIDTETE